MLLVLTSLRPRHSQCPQYTASPGIVFGTLRTGVVCQRVRPSHPTGTGHVAQMRPH